jgi:hypothetical protein
MDELTIELSPAITVNGRDYTSLTLREPKAVELQRASDVANAVASQIRLIQLVSGAPQGVIENMPERKFREAMRFLAGFSQPGDGEGHP